MATKLLHLLLKEDLLKKKKGKERKSCIPFEP